MLWTLCVCDLQCLMKICKVILFFTFIKRAVLNRCHLPTRLIILQYSVKIGKAFSVWAFTMQTKHHLFWVQGFVFTRDEQSTITIDIYLNLPIKCIDYPILGKFVLGSILISTCSPKVWFTKVCVQFLHFE